jgi:nucleotide-binding universal stress UspA family protein
MYDAILVPTDGSAGMGRVVDHAATLAREHGAAVHGVYVVDTASWTGLPMESSFEGVGETLRDEGESALRHLEGRLDDSPVRTEIREGSPAREIVDAATRESCDLVVMGTHGRSGVDRLLLGSVAERVVRSSPVPVLTVRVTDDHGSAHPTSGDSDGDTVPG